MNMNSNLNYTKTGDYLLPNLTLNQPRKPLGKYGRLRRTYLMNHRPVLYNTMLLNGSLYPHLMEVEQTAESRMQQTMAQLLKQNPAPDKEQNQMVWVQHMNSLREQIEEVIKTELIYTSVFWMLPSPPKLNKLKKSTKRRAKKRPPLFRYLKWKLRMNCASTVQDLWAVNSALWLCTRPSLTVISVPKRWQKSTASVGTPTIFWTEAGVL